MRFLIPVVLATALCGGFLFILINDPGTGDAPDGSRNGTGDDSSLAVNGSSGSDDRAHADDGDPGERVASGGRRNLRDKNARRGVDDSTRDPDGRGVATAGSNRDAPNRTTRGTGGNSRNHTRNGDRAAADRKDPIRSKERNQVWNDDEDGEDPSLEYIDVQGTVVVEDTSGAQFKEEDGTFIAFSRVGVRQIRSTVEFEAGQWTGRVPEGGLFEVRDLNAGGRAARVEFRRRKLDAGETVEIIAAWSKPYLLRVLGDEDQDLPDVEVVTNLRRTHFQHPGNIEDSNVLAVDVPSPVDVASLGDHRVVWVSAPDYAWERVQIPSHNSREEREEQVVKLTRSARATVTLDNFTPDSDSKLRIRAASRSGQGLPHTEFDLDVYLQTSYGEIPLIGLRPGNYTVSVEVGEYGRSPTVLGQENLSIDRHEESSVHLILDDAPTELEPVTLGGILVLPRAAVDATIVLNVEPLELFSAGHETRRSVPRQDMEEGEVDGTLLWNVGSVLPGRYTVEVEPFQYREIISVEDGHATEVRIEIPELAEVTLCAVDKDSQDPVVLTSLSWQAKPPSGVTRQSFRSARLDEDSGCYTVLAPEGEITVSFSGSGVRRQYKKYTVAAGPSDITLEVSVDPGIRVRLLDGTTAVSITNHASVTAQEVGGSGRKDWWSLKDGILEMYVTREGLYEVNFSAIPGYQSIATQEIQVIDGRIVELDVQVQKKP